MNALRNHILIALAFDATPAEIEHAHDIIDRVYGPDGNAGVDPAYLVNQAVPGQVGGVTAHGQAVQVTTDTTTSGITFDKNGLPWDERIHSSTKALTATGEWRKKRGVSDALVTQVENELRGTMQSTGPAPGATPPTNTPPATGPALPGSTGPALPGAGLPSLPGANAAPVVDPVYTAFVKFIADNTNSPANPAGKLTDAFVTQVLEYFGVPEGSLQNLAHNLSRIGEIEAYIRQQLGA